ncbi:MAG: tRNA (adenosine(37)-N6)-dimethylallyltransferase MiaA, partial [Erysipelotrichaceae bacterium]|nr:tRNA (adenosine(37)-N6)-dimethylallyltransferase MiaA [Erysipelotrichaceae bacterium]
GTGLYIKALLYDYSFTEMEANHEEYEDIATADLYERLKQLDPESVEKIHPNNRRRIVRALQMADSGHPKSEQEAGQNHAMLYDCKIIGLTIDREQLRERIGLRVDKMMEAGLLEEVRGLKDRYGWDNQAMKAIGYKEFRDYFSGNISLEEAVERVKVHTRQFAKRQYTWWNNQMPVSWFDISDPDYLKKIEREIKDWLC